MKNTKKMISILLLVVLVVSLTACGSGSTFERGVWTEQTYENTFADITFEAPEDWYIATDEEIATTMNLGLEETYGDQSALTKKIMELKCVYDAYVIDQLTGTNVIISYENLSLSLGGTKFDEEDYLDTTENQLKGMTNPAYEMEERSTVQIGEQEYRMLTATVTDYGMKQAYLVRRVDNYMVGIIITTVGLTSLEDVLSNFK